MSVTKKKIDEVEIEIDRLLKRISELRETRHEDSKITPSDNLDYDGLPYMINYLAHTGAIKRASMDLTRALARLRSSKD